jgi:hypothetical protein
MGHNLQNFPEIVNTEYAVGFSFEKSFNGSYTVRAERLLASAVL